jgi:hypothetical protein
MFKLKQTLIALVAVFTLLGVEARGESFMITDVRGSAYVITYDGFGPPILYRRLFFGMTGPGLSIGSSEPPGGGGDFGDVEARDACIIIACKPGMVIGTNSSYSGIIAPPEGGHATVNGVFYYTVGLTGALNFVSPPLLIEESGVAFTRTLPFTFSGELTGNAIVPFQPVVNPIFTATLSGYGYVSFHFLDTSFGTGERRYYRLSFAEYHFGPFPISIDVKPTTFPNNINPRSKGKIPVAILTTGTFDATEVDPATLLFGATGNEVAPVRFASEDVDGDGDIDLVLHFVTQDTDITCGDVSVSLTGVTFDGIRVKGSDVIETVPCN